MVDDRRTVNSIFLCAAHCMPWRKRWISRRAHQGQVMQGDFPADDGKMDRVEFAKEDQRIHRICSASVSPKIIVASNAPATRRRRDLGDDRERSSFLLQRKAENACLWLLW